ncbi:putative thioesterase involved in non-ribosomal peptide biosynthesis [Mycolicibacterium chubuense NBB4]|uniref:Thioesterase TesA n=1 Tax=Mycolicibacterium chubuense (strain NBB4) TaxID=710421 RepID=I4BQK7_MYCCN|nr:alpha/beta fold hydrolase [Mycolicibacterium chubuense]AFM19564.1 putative thioesterase involved in non-ribosomal peptide biosynthesis [Mycolicibacterium chubuense NBB4]
MTTPSDRSRWIRNFNPSPDAAVRLVCFPHAGGSASYFFPLSRALAPEFDIYAVQYPGRQDRYSEPFVDSIDGLADEIAAALDPLTDAPVAFFGHSMGAVLAFEVARRVEARDGRRPVTVFASGSRAPSRYGDEREHKGDYDLVQVMRDLGGTDPRVLNNPEMLDTFLPAFRNDYRALQAYHRGTDVGISAPIVVMTATDDPKTSEADARAWHEHTTGGGDVHTFTGGHFYLEKHPERVIEVIAQTLRAR